MKNVITNAIMYAEKRVKTTKLSRHA
uniref:Uncharacterized protein n=1 Tax=Anguilla anguilla TaxID=7936 RepID=A0A0E9PYU1_ANGAN